MGCRHSTITEACHIPVPRLKAKAGTIATASVSILVTGPALGGKSAFCKRFLDDEFTGGSVDPVAGSRLLQVGATAVRVTVTDVDHADAAQLQPDAVIVVVSALEDEPFDGIYKYLDTLHTGKDTGVRMHSLCCSNDAAASWSTVSTARESPLSQVFAGDASVGSITSNRSLTLNTQQSAPSDIDTAPGLGVVVSLADRIDAKVHGTRRVRRLKAMSTNWADANRCQVTFASCKTGEGVHSAVASVARQLVGRQSSSA